MAGYKFGEAVRNSHKVRTPDGDETLKGAAIPHTGQAGMSSPEKGGSKQRKAKGKYRSIRIEPQHAMVDGKKKIVHTIHVEHHQPKHKGNGPTSPYREPMKHMHTDPEEAKRHVGQLMDGLEPEDDPDSRDLAAGLD